MRFRLFRRRLAVQLVGISTLVVTLTIAYLSIATYLHQRELNRKRFGSGLERFIQVAALQIDAEVHRSVGRTQTGDAVAQATAARKADAWLERARALRDTDDLEVFSVHIDDPAALAAEGPDAPVTLPVALPAPGMDPGDPHTFPPEARNALRRVVVRGDSAYTRIHPHEGRERVSAFAALLHDGSVVGLLVGHRDVSAGLAAETQRFSATAVYSSLAILLAILLSAGLAWSIGEALRRIRRGAAAIEAEDYDHRIVVTREDELGLVAAQFNQMAETLAERVEMLKYLPAHARDAIVRLTRGETQAPVDEVEASVLFSDIRGYTELSEAVGAAGVVQMLNVYLRRQAEILAAHGGIIDKFIGDAVLSVFLGANHARRAIEAGEAIQTAIEQLNAEGQFQRAIHVGIGIATGTLLIADIGSDERRERSLVGTVVNLAARLCSRGSAGELVISAATHAHATDAASRGEPVQFDLKGFSGPVEAWVLRIKA